MKGKAQQERHRRQDIKWRTCSPVRSAAVMVACSTSVQRQTVKGHKGQGTKGNTGHGKAQ